MKTNANDWKREAQRLLDAIAAEVEAWERSPEGKAWRREVERQHDALAAAWG